MGHSQRLEDTGRAQVEDLNRPSDTGRGAAGTALATATLDDVRGLSYERSSSLPKSFPTTDDLLQDLSRSPDNLPGVTQEQSQMADKTNKEVQDKKAGTPASEKDQAWEKVMNQPYIQDATEFQKRFGQNPNSPEAIAWLEKKMQERIHEEAKQSEDNSERRGLAAVGEPGLGYGQMLLGMIGAQCKNFNPNNINWSYFQHGTVGDPDAGWHNMKGFGYKM